jgi:FKBP-type peptidyl-prolyl cis-trans isomerase FklB
MKRLILSAGALALPFHAAASLAADAPALDETGRMSYALGFQLGRDLAGTQVNNDAMLKGLADGRSGAEPKLPPDQMQAALTTLEQRINEQRGKEQAVTAQKAATAGNAYLAENAKKEGVKTTASGLQYKVVKPGTGRSPKPTDTVTVHYRGTLVDGQEFDSSHKRGQPATFPVNGVIAGWTEALQMMKEGAQYQLVIPPKLAYADRGPLAGQVLVFDVELLKVEPAAPPK